MKNNESMNCVKKIIFNHIIFEEYFYKVYEQRSTKVGLSEDFIL